MVPGGRDVEKFAGLALEKCGHARDKSARWFLEGNLPCLCLLFFFHSFLLRTMSTCAYTLYCIHVTSCPSATGFRDHFVWSIMRDLALLGY